MLASVTVSIFCPPGACFLFLHIQHCETRSQFPGTGSRADLFENLFFNFLYHFPVL